MTSFSLNIDREIDVSNISLMSIEVINITGKKKTTLPDWLFHLPRLKTLYLNLSALKEIDPKVFEIESLENLTVKNSKLEKIEFRADMKCNLKNLNLSQNALTEIPKGLEFFPNLELLNLSSNPIPECHFSFMKLARLRFLYLDNVGFKMEKDDLKDHPSLKIISLE